MIFDQIDIVDYIFSFLTVYEQLECSRVTKFLYIHFKKNILLTYGPPITIYLKNFGVLIKDERHLFKKCSEFCAIKKTHKIKTKKRNYLLEYVDMYFTDLR